MVDEDNKDEYQLADPDILGMELDEPPEENKTDSAVLSEGTPVDMKRMIRHGLIVVGVLFLLMFFYKIIGSYISNKKATSAQLTLLPAKTEVNSKKLEQASLPLLDAGTEVKPAKTNQLTTLEQQQQTLGAEVVSMTTQLGTVSTALTDVTTKIAELNQMVVALNEKIDAQSRELIRLESLRLSPPIPKTRPVVRRPIQREPVVTYYLQAIIPGRAWLIATNGATLTVRQGTKVNGYGAVRLIDPKQGRVIMSSGRTIQFSQADS